MTRARTVSKVVIPAGFAIVGWMLKAVVMSDFGPLVLALLSVTLLMAYMALAGYTAGLWTERHRRECLRAVIKPQPDNVGNVNHRYRDRCDQFCDMKVRAVFVGIFWPGALPTMLGASLVAKPSRRPGLDAEIKRLEAELGMGKPL